jgi:hypothetical protein
MASAGKMKKSKKKDPLGINGMHHASLRVGDMGRSPWEMSDRGHRSQPIF